MDPQTLNDDALLEKLKNADVVAFNEIYNRYWKIVFRYAVSKVQSQQVAEDICQDIFVSMWQRRYSLEIINLEAFLIQSAKYAVINYFRSKSRDKIPPQTIVSLQSTDNETENTLAFRNLMEAWEKAVLTLPVKTQEIFRLSKIQHFSNEEIATKLQLTVKAVEYHITKSYKLLRVQLRDYILLLAIYFF